MADISYETPYGTEQMYGIILQMQLDVLDEKLTLLKEKYVDLPFVQEIVDQMLPSVLEMLEDELEKNYCMDITLTPTTLFGFGCAIEYRYLLGVQEIENPLETWALGLVLMEKLMETHSGLTDMVIQPQYVENAMNIVIGNFRVSVSLRPNTNLHEKY